MEPSVNQPNDSSRADSVQGHVARPIMYGRQVVEELTGAPALQQASPQQPVVQQNIVSTPQASTQPTSNEVRSTSALTALTEPVVQAPEAPAIQPTINPADSPITIQSRVRVNGGEADQKLLRHSKLTLTMTTMAVAAFVAGIGLGINNLWLSNKSKNQVSALTSQSNKTDVPAETKPSDNDINNYSVGPDLPRLINIEKINVKARVRQIGVKTDNTLMAPDNIYDVGWYTGSAKPGQTGTVVIDGHVHGPTKPGIFTDLKKLVAGDKLQIERGDHKLIKYKVVKTKVYDVNKVDMAAVMTSAVAGSNGLNLITCTGSIDYSTDSYSQRLVVFAVQVP